MEGSSQIRKLFLPLARFRRLLLVRFSKRLVFYVELKLRQGFTSKYRGADAKLDKNLRFAALDMLGARAKIDFDDANYDEELISRIRGSSSDHLERVLDRHARELKSITEILNGKNRYPVGITAFGIWKKIGALNWRIRSVRRLFAETNAERIAIEYRTVVRAITVAAPILVIGGYLRLYLIAMSFRFPMTMVYTTTDYVAAAADTLFIAAVSTAFAIVVAFWSYFEETRLDENQKRWLKKEQRILIEVMAYVSGAALIIGVVLGYSQAIQLFPIPFVYFSGRIVIAVLTRYFNNGRRLVIAVYGIVLFLGNVWFSTTSDVVQLKSGTKNLYTIEYATASSNTVSEQVVLVTRGHDSLVTFDAIDQTTSIISSRLLIRISSASE